MSGPVPMTAPVTKSSPLGAAPSTARHWRGARPQSMAMAQAAARIHELNAAPSLIGGQRIPLETSTHV